MQKKALIIRFSSFGDIVQCMSTLGLFKENSCSVDWLTKSEFSSVVRLSPQVDKVISFDKKLGMWGLIKLALSLRAENYEYIYDAHSNIRSRVVCAILSFAKNVSITRRSKNRIKRALFFYLKIKNIFPVPFYGMKSYQGPLEKFFNLSADYDGRHTWNFEKFVDTHRIIQELLPEKDFFVLVPGAAHALKRWPVEHFRSLVANYVDREFVILGGPGDDFCEDIAKGFSNVFNLAGKLSLIESCFVISMGRSIVSNDTGLIHVAEILGKKGTSLIGPSAFGFPTYKNIEYKFLDLDCSPCSKDGSNRCTNKVVQKCMKEISPEQITL